MNKKQNLLAIALSASFVLAGANVAEASEQSQSTNYSEVQNQNTNNVAKETAIEAQANTQNADANANPENNTNDTEESTSKKETLDDFINNEGIESLFDVEKINANAKENLNADAEEKLEEALAKAPQAQGAEAPANAAETDTPVQTSKDVNYAEDEKKIEDFDESERYRSTQMEQGAGTIADYIPPDKMDEFIDGYRYHSS